MSIMIEIPPIGGQIKNIFRFCFLFEVIRRPQWLSLSASTSPSPLSPYPSLSPSLTATVTRSFFIEPLMRKEEESQTLNYELVLWAIDPKRKEFHVFLLKNSTAKMCAIRFHRTMVCL